MSDATLTQPYGVAVRLEAEPDEIETEISMHRTALLLTVASLALAGCWDDETADDETTATTEELAAAPSQSQTQALDGELPIEAATSEQQLTDDNAAALSEALAEADAERASLMAQRVALEDEIASLRAESASVRVPCSTAAPTPTHVRLPSAQNSPPSGPRLLWLS